MSQNSLNSSLEVRMSRKVVSQVRWDESKDKIKQQSKDQNTILSILRDSQMLPKQVETERQKVPPVRGTVYVARVLNVRCRIEKSFLLVKVE